MTRPDLETETGRAAYRAELKRVAWPLRLGGLVLIVVAALLVLSAREGWVGTSGELATNAGYILLGLGWALFIAAIFVRTRYHKRRLAEGL